MSDEFLDMDDYVESRNIPEDVQQAARQRTADYINQYELKQARKAKKLTQAQLAKRMGVSQKRISTLESGDVWHLKVGTIRRYVEMLGGKLTIKITIAGKTINFGG
jgi:DNA-binding XRE family transcriptional regulator